MKKDANPIIYYDECTICLELIVEIYGHESRACRTTCNHVFHYDCLRRWFEWQKSCPVCSSGFKSLPKKEHGRSIGLTEIQEERSNQCSVE
mgnify:FL=1